MCDLDLSSDLSTCLPREAGGGVGGGFGCGGVMIIGSIVVSLEIRIEEMSGEVGAEGIVCITFGKLCATAAGGNCGGGGTEG